MRMGLNCAAALATVLAMPALAAHCPADVKAIDTALAKLWPPRGNCERSQGRAR